MEAAKIGGYQGNDNFKKDFRHEIAGQARNDSKGAASDLEVAQQQAKRRQLRCDYLERTSA